MMPHRIALLVAGAALTLTLAACGGGSSSTASNASSETTSAQRTEADPTTAAAASGGSLTPPGTKLGLGREATVGWVPPSTYDAAGAQQGIELQVAVDSIEKGTIDDFRNIELEPEQRHSTPYYVKVRVKTLGMSEPPAIDDPDVSFEAIDDRGQQQQSITFIGTFPHCEDQSPPEPFKDGKSYESCLTYLMPGGGSIERVEWADGPSKPNEVTPYFDEPVVWAGS
jgi:hypothetical protein